MTDPVRRCVLAVVVAAVIGAGHYFAPLQPGAFAFDLGLVATVAGAVSVVHPLPWLDIRTRWTGLCVLGGGLALAVLVLLWPPTLHTVPIKRYVLDEFLPTYSSREVHSQLVHAPAARVCRAIHECTPGDIRVLVPLMQLRMMRFARGPVPAVPVLELMSGPHSQFLLLSDDGRQEVVLGIVGRFWSGATERLRTPEEFRAYQKPGAAKSAFHFHVEDLGDGWSRIRTETRVIGVDEVGTRAMTRYWRIIYPGSAVIRRMWLLAIRDRAER